MPMHVSKQGGKFRLVEMNGKLVKNAQGRPVDGGGHMTRAEAEKQMQAINISKHKK